MSSPYPPQPPKRLERSKSNRVLGGVCAGVANYLNMDPTLVRVLTVVISLFTGVPVILYIIALFVVPEEGSQPVAPGYPPVAGPQTQASGFPTAPPQGAQPAYSPVGTSGPTQPSQPATPPVSAEDAIWGTEGAPWEQRQPAPQPTMQPAPVPTMEPEPAVMAPSEPEAPVVPAAHEADATESVPEPEGPEDRPSGTENPPTDPGGAASAEASEGGQQTDRPGT
jgi:phage shock protein PspC (stress-responsive transcriptional regulator)